jgi:hypothetical protein
MSVQELVKPDLEAEVNEIVKASEHARDEMFKISAEADRTGDVAPAMELAWKAGIHRLSIHRDFGGLSDGNPRFQLEAAAKALLNIAQGEQSCGQMLGTQMLHLRMTFNPESAVTTSLIAADSVCSQLSHAFGNESLSRDRRRRPSKSSKSPRQITQPVPVISAVFIWARACTEAIRLIV